MLKKITLYLAVFVIASSAVFALPPASTSAAAPLEQWEVDGFISLESNQYGTCALTPTSKIWCWGSTGNYGSP